MGLNSSKDNAEKDTEIQTLKADIVRINDLLQEKSICITLLRNELESIRQLQGIDGLNSDFLDAVNKAHMDRDYDYLVLSGGGVKGVSFGGAVDSLDKLKILYNEQNQMKLKGFAVVSAGSIIGSLLAVGYTPTELSVIIKDIDFEKIFDDGLWYIKDAINFIEDWGACPGNYLLDLLGNLIKQKTGNPDYSLEDLYRDKNFKLVCATTDMCEEKTIYLYAGNPVKEYSNIPVRKAVRMSMGIPFLYEPIELNDGLFVDGGVLDNFPLHVFDGDYPGDPKARLNICTPNPKVLGIKIMTSDEQLNYDIMPKQKFAKMTDYGMSFIDTFLTENDRRMMTPSFWIRSIIIVTPNYPLTKMSLTDTEKEDLITRGSKAVNDFFVTKSLMMRMNKKK